MTFGLGVLNSANPKVDPFQKYQPDACHFTHLNDTWLLLLLYETQGCKVASLSEDKVVPVKQCPLQVRAGIWKLFTVQAIACPHFTKGTVGSLISTN